MGNIQIYPFAVDTCYKVQFIMPPVNSVFLIIQVEAMVSGHQIYLFAKGHLSLPKLFDQ